MICTSCGAGVDTNSRFCPYCGKAIENVCITEETQYQPVLQQGNTDVSYPVINQSQQSAEQSGKAFGILLCVTASIFFLGIIPDGYSFSISGPLWVMVYTLRTLPLTIALLIVGLREISLSKRVRRTRNVSSYHLILGIALIVVSVELLMSFVGVFSTVLRIEGNYSLQEYQQAALFDFIRNVVSFSILAVGTTMLFIAAHEKKKEEASSKSLMVAGILLLVYIFLVICYMYIIMPYSFAAIFSSGYETVTQDSIISLITMTSSLLMGSVYTAAIIILGAGLISRHKTLNPE